VLRAGKNDEYWGIMLLEMAEDARRDGDFATAELLTTAVIRCFDEADRMAMIDDEISYRQRPRFDLSPRLDIEVGAP
jgi:hypothetical protein